MDIVKLKTVDFRPYLVFSSVGRYSRADSWLSSRVRNYDVMLVVYAGDPGRYREDADYLFENKGGKWQNLLSVLQFDESVLDNYEAIWVVDDDLSLSPVGISKLFNYLFKYNLNVVQPSFNALGKNSYSITVENPLTKIRFTNFCETGSPLIRSDILKRFMMECYTPELSGYGVDWLLMHFLDKYYSRSVGIVDDVRVFNPPDSFKGGAREIDLLESRSERIKKFKNVMANCGFDFENDVPLEVGRVYNYNIILVAYRLIRKYFIDKLRRRVRWLVRDFKSIAKRIQR